jgi:putative membrane protein
MPEDTDDTRLITILLIVIGAIIILPMGFEMMGFGSMMGGMWGGGMWGDGAVSGWMFIVGIVMQLLFLVAPVGGEYLLYRAVTGGESDFDQAMEELRLAYARGDLTDEEYEQRKTALERDT